MSKAVGRNTKHLIGVRADKATDAVTFFKYFAKSNSMGEKFDSKESEALTGKRFASDEMMVAVAIDGDMPLEYTKESLARLLSIFGTTDTVSGVTNYKHTFKIAQSVEKWVDIVKVTAGLGTGGTAFSFERFNKCKANTLTFEIVKKAYITGTAGFVGTEQITAQTDFKTGIPVGVTVTDIVDTKLVCFDSSIVLEGNIDAIINSVKINLNNALDGDDYGLNSKFRRDITAQKGEITLDVECDFDVTQYNALKAKIKANTYTTDCTISVGTDIKFLFPKLKLSDISSPITGGDKITMTFKAKALWDSVSDNIMTVEITDTNATSYTA